MSAARFTIDERVFVERVYGIDTPYNTFGTVQFHDPIDDTYEVDLDGHSLFIVAEDEMQPVSVVDATGEEEEEAY